MLHVNVRRVPRRLLHSPLFDLSALSSLPARIAARLRGLGYAFEALERRILYSGDTADTILQLSSGVWTEGVVTYVGNDSTNFLPTPATDDVDIKDHSFGDEGVVTLNLFDLESAHSVLVQPDGKIVVAGWSGPRPTDPNEIPPIAHRITLVRLNADGTLDTSFGDDGVATIDGLPTVDLPGQDDRPFYHSDEIPLVLLADGKFLVGGFCLHRLNADDSIDETFGDGGAADSLPFVQSIAVQADGKIVTADDLFAFRRFNADGSIDQTFGDNGTASMVPSGGLTTLGEIVVQPDGKILAVGMFDGRHEDHRPDHQIMLTRLNPDGTADESFGDGGFVFTARADDPHLGGHSVALTPDGKIIVGGSGAALVRYFADGSLDTSFGDGGMVVNSEAQTDKDVVVLADGKILAADNGFDSMTVFRYNPDGTIDESFGSHGRWVHKAVTGEADFRVSEGAYGMAVQEDGKIVVVGQIELGNASSGPEENFAASDFYVFRLNGDAAPAELPTEMQNPPAGGDRGGGGSTETPAPAETDDSSSPDDEPTTPTARLFRAGSPFFAIRVALAFDFDDPTNAKGDIGADPEETVLPPIV